ncbi:cyclase family protein [Aquipuribacter sp. MA13-6]|uniref:cyclase family protein n=1 Tax=unclassified Aquipuribacter TaxID=2635084 RepID=UPI003EEE506F
MDAVSVVAVVDLSVPVGPTTFVHPGDPATRLDVHATVARDGYNLLRVSMGSQTGTHVDAPFHVDAAGARVDELDLRLLTGPAVLVDATGLPPHGRITAAHLDPVRGALRPGVVVLLRTGWSSHQGTPAYLQHPALDPAACAELLAAGVRTVGIDAPSLDPTGAEDATAADLPCHHLLAAAGGVIAENLTDLHRVLELTDPLVCLFPVRLQGADGAPVRAVALQLAR